MSHIYKKPRKSARTCAPPRSEARGASTAADHVGGPGAQAKRREEESQFTCDDGGSAAPSKDTNAGRTPRIVKSWQMWLMLSLLQAPGFALGAESEAPPPPLKVKPAERALKEDTEAPLPLDQLPQAPEVGTEAKSHRRGGAPAVPAARLPEDVPLSEVNAKSRQAIAEGPISEELKAGASDPELLALRDAERVLFPEPVRGVQSSWSFDLPESADPSSRTLGLPLVLGSDASVPGVDPEEVKWLRTLTLPDLPVRLDRRVVTYLKFYRDSHRGRTIAAIWARKSGRYVAEMKAQLRRAGLPTDLVWLSMIESGHNPTIRSPAGAVGLWQFMPESGRMYGLTVDRWVDERRDPARATQAAIRFLSDLYQRFGNWELAMGAYNMGYAGMSRAVSKYNTNDYWTLSRLESGLPWETTLYVPKIFALAIVMSNREAFGIGRSVLDPSETFDTIYVSPATPLDEAAKAAGLARADLEALNPGYLAGRIPPQESGKIKKWPLRVPPGTGEKTLAKLKLRAAPVETHRIRWGDSIAAIADDYGVSEAALVSENALEAGERLREGTVLLLPPSARKKSGERPLKEVVLNRTLTPAKGQRRIFYEVTPGDRLPEIAAALSVTESELMRWNALAPDAHLRDEMTLQALVPEDLVLSHVRHLEQKEVRTFLAGSPEFHEHFEALKGKKRLQIAVQKGDTLLKIGQRFGMTVGSMERVNRRSRTTELVPGEHLIVYTDKNVAEKDIAGITGDLPPVVAPIPEALP